MKRTKRLSIEFLRREITIAVSKSSVTGPDEVHPKGESPTICPTCGSPWMTVVEHQGGNAAASVSSIYRTLQQHGLHLHISAAGQVSICRRSFEEVKEKL